MSKLSNNMVIAGKRVVLTVGLLAAVTACTGRTGMGDAPADAPASSGGTVALGRASNIARDGIFDVSRTNEAKFRVQIDGVLSGPKRTVLRVTVTNLEATEQLGIDRFGDSSSDYSFVGFKLLDPVGGKLYHAYRLDNPYGLGFGSRLNEIKLQPGVHYSAVVYFPPLPQSVTAVTVLSPGTTGEFTGVPVTAGSYTATPAAEDARARVRQILAINSPHPPGTTVELPAVEPPAGAFSLAADVSGLVVGPDRETLSSSAQTSVALRSDILFDFGKATLTAKAHTLVAEAAKEITDGADPSRPISVVGHTDGKGSPSDNQKLSEQRAQAVEAQLRAALGGGWQFTVSGKGESEPLAEERKPDGSDDPQGRARNRRVEFTYPRKSATGAANAGGAAATQATGGGGRPAAFRADNGTVVAERDGTSDSQTDSVGPVKFHLRVYPFYRDGGYLVAVFDLANVSGTKLDPGLNYFRSAAYPGPAYASFGVIDPATGAAYRTAYVAIADNVNSYLDGQLHGWQTAQPQRAYMYVPAPPAGVTSVTFDAGPFGKIKNVPVN
ncbi:OmpA family protein [Micromonospora sp. KC606]|uniref:OmpA family protein n=1 Tax=Micromonospora sp. KC606 TaxID=2530379 RepID=UPI0010461194|nr:OmpA family protein [Micromonospora sp. KC606]TDC82390.1 OmpA family protein [Micromonospora sp. KC606]